LIEAVPVRPKLMEFIAEHYDNRWRISAGPTPMSGTGALGAGRDRAVAPLQEHTSEGGIRVVAFVTGKQLERRGISTCFPPRWISRRPSSTSPASPIPATLNARASSRCAQVLLSYLRRAEIVHTDATRRAGSCSAAAP